jgi:hypothetical protein
VRLDVGKFGARTPARPSPSHGLYLWLSALDGTGIAPEGRGRMPKGRRALDRTQRNLGSALSTSCGGSGLCRKLAFQSEPSSQAIRNWVRRGRTDDGGIVPTCGSSRIGRCRRRHRRCPSTATHRHDDIDGRRRATRTDSCARPGPDDAAFAKIPGDAKADSSGRPVRHANDWRRARGPYRWSTARVCGCAWIPDLFARRALATAALQPGRGVAGACGRPQAEPGGPWP